MKLGQIVEALGGELLGPAELEIRQVAPLERALHDEIGFVAQAKYRAQLTTTQAGVVIVPGALREADTTAAARIVTRDPYLYFAQVVRLLNPVVPPAPGVDPSAVVRSPIPASAHVAAQAYVGVGCQIGEGVVIGPGCTVEDNVSIGADTVLRARVSVCSDTTIGARCILHPGCVVGSDGFGFAHRADGSWEKILQIGRVRIGDDVEIGANTTVDRGALDDTVIENGVKLDNLIQIAHNCRIGENSAMAGHSGMAGSSTLGKRVMVGGQSAIMGHITVGDDVVVSARSFLSKSVPAKGIYTGAVMAQAQKDWQRNAVHLRHLDEMASRIRALEKKLSQIGDQE